MSSVGQSLNETSRKLARRLMTMEGNGETDNIKKSLKKGRPGKGPAGAGGVASKQHKDSRQSNKPSVGGGRSTNASLDGHRKSNSSRYSLSAM